MQTSPSAWCLTSLYLFQVACLSARRLVRVLVMEPLRLSPLVSPEHHLRLEQSHDFPQTPVPR